MCLFIYMSKVTTSNSSPQKKMLNNHLSCVSCPQVFSRASTATVPEGLLKEPWGLLHQTVFLPGNLFWRNKSTNSNVYVKKDGLLFISNQKRCVIPYCITS